MIVLIKYLVFDFYNELRRNMTKLKKNQHRNQAMVLEGRAEEQKL
jgi:hypothetical protein